MTACPKCGVKSWWPAAGWRPAASVVKRILFASSCCMKAAGMPHALFAESERFEGRVLTSFEKKGLAKGHTIHDFAYRAV